MATHRIIRYHVHFERHGTVRPCVTLRDARDLARAERRDGWSGTWIERLRDGAEIAY